MRRFLAIFLCLCLFPYVALSENVEDSLVLGMVSTRTTEIRPLIPKESSFVSLYNMVYESLVVIDDNGLPQPHLCQKWSESGSGKTWTFVLRDDITFSDGTPLTAHDVAASGNYILALAKNDTVQDRGFYQNFQYIISSIEALDDITIQVTAKRSYYGLLYAMTFPVVPASQVDMPNPLGTGPYIISSFSPTEHLWLNVNERWWQTLPQVKELMVTFFPNNKDMITAYEFGRVDTVFTRSVAAAQYKSGISSLSIPYSTRQIEVLMMNHGEFPLENQNVRLAIRYAINVEQIVNHVYMGMSIDANTPIPANSWLYLDEESDYVYNPEYAAELLAAEGWADTDNDTILDKVVGDGQKNLRLRLYVYEDPENDVRFETANMIADMLAQVNIKVTVTEMSYGDVLYQLKEGGFDLALCAFETDVVPDIGFFLRGGASENYSRYKSTEMTALIDTLRTKYTPEDFAYTSQAIQRQFSQDIPFISLFYRTGSILTRKMYTTVRSIREYELLRGIEAFGR